jgi:hypothetical protein
MEHPKDVGDRTTLALMLALRDAGYVVSLPSGENMRYDLVIDDGRRLSRVQCKSGRIRNGAVVFKTSSSYAHHASAAQPRRHYQAQVDFFGVYCSRTGGTYLIPIDDLAPTTEALLRVTPARNGQPKRIREAADYEIARIDLTRATPALLVTSGAR